MCAAITACAISSLSFTAEAGEWYKDGDRWCYKQSDGSYMKEGWFKDKDGLMYNFSGGYARTGWFNEDGVWYYFNPESAEKMTGWIQDDTKRYFFLNPDGVMQTGWMYSNGKWYYLEKDGHMVSADILTTNENKFHFQYDGSLSMNAWVEDGDKEYYANETGTLAKGQWVGDRYVGKNSQASDREDDDVKRIPYKYYSLTEYKDLALDSLGRYSGSYSELIYLFNEYRSEYNDDHVYNYNGDDENWIDEHELKEWDEDEELNKAACLRAVELASQQRSSGARPDGRDPKTVLEDYGIPYETYVETVGFGQRDYEAFYEDLKSNSSHTSKWKNINLERVGVGCAYDESGEAYWVIIYVE